MLEKCALIATTDSLLLGLDSLNKIATVLFETDRFLEDGRLALSSGNAELKFQSSSAVEPLL